MKLLHGFVIFTLVLGACSSNTDSSEACGDGIVDIGEDCDVAVPDGETCGTRGYYGGTLGCNPDCTFDESACLATGWCGDLVIQGEHEDCDGSVGNDTCVTLGFTGGTLGCSPSCTFDTEACVLCGDYQAQGSEECDGSDLQGTTCQDLGYYGGELACDATTCRYDTSPCAAFGSCGDGLIQSPFEEECDGLAMNGVDLCVDEGAQYYDNGGHVVCGEDCRYSYQQCASCGDGIIQGDFGEQCDGTQLGGLTCQSLLFGAGTLACHDCRLDTSGCTVQPYDQISCGSYLTLVLNRSGGLFAAGNGDEGELANGLMADSATPVMSLNPPGDGFTAVSAAWVHACALDTSGDAWCWGLGDYGTLGTGTTTDSATPVAVVMPSGVAFTRIVAGSLGYSCALDTAGAAWCWGNNVNGTLGTGTTANAATPVLINMPSGVTFTDLAGGGAHVCALDSARQVWCWGDNALGAIGDGTTDMALEPVPTTQGMGLEFTVITAGSSHSCAVDTAGTGWCWGRGNNGQIGDGSEVTVLTPTAVVMPGGELLTTIDAGDSHTCALDTAGRGWCWGGLLLQSLLGNLSGPNQSPVPLQVFNLTNFYVAISAGYNHTCTLDDIGVVRCWGRNGQGQLGLGTNDNADLPQAFLDPE